MGRRFSFSAGTLAFSGGSFYAPTPIRRNADMLRRRQGRAPRRCAPSSFFGKEWIVELE